MTDDTHIVRLAADVHHLQSDMTEVKGDVHQLKSDMTEVKGEIKSLRSMSDALRSDSCGRKMSI